jgi:hypothetical protein
MISKFESLAGAAILAVFLSLPATGAAAQTQAAQNETSQSQSDTGTGGAVAPAPYATFPIDTVLGTHGYFEVSPGGSLIFYPTWSSVEPGVMQTIFAMMGATSLVNRRGHYQVGSDRKVRFFLPPGTTPGFFTQEMLQRGGAAPAPPDAGQSPRQPAAPPRQ